MRHAGKWVVDSEQQEAREQKPRLCQEQNRKGWAT